MNSKPEPYPNPFIVQKATELQKKLFGPDVEKGDFHPESQAPTSSQRQSCQELSSQYILQRVLLQRLLIPVNPRLVLRLLQLHIHFLLVKELNLLVQTLHKRMVLVPVLDSLRKTLPKPLNYSRTVKAAERG